jgi:rhomboid family GlyGly-CTERM serine protease
MKPLRPALTLFALPAVLIALLPATHGALLYDRDAILRGEVWRLWTGHWVHFSASHLCWNLGVLLVAGTGLELARPGLLRRYTLLAAPLISAAFLVVAPAMQAYGGLSGLATGVVTLLAPVKISDGPRDRAWWFAILGLVAAKILIDARHESPLFSEFASPDIRTSAWAHALGAGVALLLIALPRGARPQPTGSGEPLASRLPGSDAYKFSGPTS